MSRLLWKRTKNLPSSSSHLVGTGRAAVGGIVIQPCTPRWVVYIVILSNLLVIYFYRQVSSVQELPQPSSSSFRPPRNPLALPQGSAIALPSIRVETNEDPRRKIYGGKGDKPHLGGFTDMDVHGVCPTCWKWMVEYVGIKSLLDVGCGRGISTAWFVLHGVDAQCVEGSHDGFETSLVPEKEKRVTEHDFSRGPWWPTDTVDAVWSVEFLEHVGRNYHENILPAFRKAALLFVTRSGWGGWHHVEIHDVDWWMNKFALYGFEYSHKLTSDIRKQARQEKEKEEIAPNGELYSPQHIWTGLMVFINPQVAALPQHAHLLAELGCFEDRVNNQIVHRECNTGKGAGMESTLPESFRPVNLTLAMDQEWEELIRKNVKQKRRKRPAPAANSTRF